MLLSLGSTFHAIFKLVDVDVDVDAVVMACVLSQGEDVVEVTEDAGENAMAKGVAVQKAMAVAATAVPRNRII